MRFSFSLMIIERRSAPMSTLSFANSKSTMRTTFWLYRAAFRAASFTRFARSAPEKPDVPRARTATSTSSDSGIFLVWTARMPSRPLSSTVRTSRAGTQQRRVEHVGAVGCRDEDDAFIRLEAIHFDEQLIEGLFALVVPAAESCSTVSADRVNFIDEDDTGGAFLAL